MGACGGGTEKQSSNFARAGTTAQTQSRVFPDFLTNLLFSTAGSAAPNKSSASAATSYLGDLISTPTVLEDEFVMDDLIALPRREDYAGRSAVRSIANVNPYDESFIEGFDDFFTSAFDEAAAAGATGPDAVRGGAGRGEFFKSDMLEKAALNKTRELASLQQRQAEITTGAASAANNIESNIRQQAVGAQDQKMRQLAVGDATRVGAVDTLTKNRLANAEILSAIANLMGHTHGLATEDLRGEGTQSAASHNWGAGVQCCFIFLEALNGDLPWYVRRGRDLMCTPQRKMGYTRMAARLVPAMRRNRVVRFLVNAVMVKPFLACGRWYFTGRGLGWAVRPLCETWFRVWDRLGKA